MPLDDLNETQQSILFELADQPLGPKQLAEKLSKTISYISQQLKILHLSGYVAKEDVDQGKGSRQTDDVRIRYSLTEETIHIQKLAHDHSYQQTLTPEPTLNYILNLYNSTATHKNHLLKFYFTREHLINQGENFYYLNEEDDINLLVITENYAPFRGEDNVIVINYENNRQTIRFWSHPIQEFTQGLADDEDYYKETQQLMHPLLITNQSKHDKIT